MELVHCVRNPPVAVLCRLVHCEKCCSRIVLQFPEKENVSTKTWALARADIFDYIKVSYNRSRIHSHLGGVSTETFEQTSS
ncbi:transposase [Kosakonia radicincitans UMEnt01/12]|nr:transposase [Kosakonia radicincitans UMEnt01/12]